MHADDNCESGEALEEIGKKAFGRCIMLQCLVIPSSVTAIHKNVFFLCTSLTSMVYCNEIQEFVSAQESMQNWWNHGLHEKSPSTYCFFIKCSLPQRLDLVRPMKWQTIIHGMIKRIPLISRKGVKSYFDLINSKLDLYEHLKNVFMLLELAIWKSKISEQFGQNVNSLTTEMKLQCRADSLSMVNKIVSFVLPFLTDDDGSSNVVTSNDDDEDSDSNDEDEDEDEDGIYDDNGDEEEDNNDGNGDDDHQDNIGFKNDVDDEDKDDEDDEGDIEGENIRRRRRRLG